MVLVEHTSSWRVVFDLSHSKHEAYSRISDFIASLMTFVFEDKISFMNGYPRLDVTNAKLWSDEFDFIASVSNAAPVGHSFPSKISNDTSDLVSLIALLNKTTSSAVIRSPAIKYQ